VQRPELEIVIDRTGRITLEVRGAPGPRCLAYADLVREIIGREDERELTAEYYAPDGKVQIDVQAGVREPR